MLRWQQGWIRWPNSLKYEISDCYISSMSWGRYFILHLIILWVVQPQHGVWLSTTCLFLANFQLRLWKCTYILPIYWIFFTYVWEDILTSSISTLSNKCISLLVLSFINSLKLSEQHWWKTSKMSIWQKQINTLLNTCKILKWKSWKVTQIWKKPVPHQYIASTLTSSTSTWMWGCKLTASHSNYRATNFEFSYKLANI